MDELRAVYFAQNGWPAFTGRATWAAFCAVRSERARKGRKQGALRAAQGLGWSQLPAQEITWSRIRITYPPARVLFICSCCSELDAINRRTPYKSRHRTNVR